MLFLPIGAKLLIIHLLDLCWHLGIPTADVEGKSEVCFALGHHHIITMKSVACNLLANQPAVTVAGRHYNVLILSFDGDRATAKVVSLVNRLFSLAISTTCAHLCNSNTVLIFSKILHNLKW